MKFRNGFVSNSSSCSFVCKTDMTIEKITEKLKLAVNYHNDIFDTNLTYDDVFLDARLINDDDWECLKPYLELDNNYVDYNSNIIINSAADNSIPYEMWDIITTRFNAEHIHLG